MSDSLDEHVDFLWEMAFRGDRSEDCDEMSDEQIVALDELVDLLAASFGLPTPWNDSNTPPDQRIRHVALYTTHILQRPHLAPHYLMRDPGLLRGEESAARLREQSRNRKGVHKAPPETLRSEIRAMRVKSGNASWTAVCASVGRKHGLSSRQVRRIVPDTKW